MAEEEQDDSPLKKLSWVPDLQMAVQQWEWDLEKKVKEVEQLKKSIKNTKQWLKETNKNRSKLFAELLADEVQVLAAYNEGYRFSFRGIELKQIYEQHNHMLITQLTGKNIHKLKRYLWETESMQTAEDWDFVVQALINCGDLVIISEFLKIQFKYMTKKSKETLAEYLDSRKLADTMIAAE